MLKRGLFIATLVLAGCTEREVLLEGERLDLRGNVVETGGVNRALPLALSPARANANWTHVGGNVQHQVGNLALGREVAVAWSADIGQGSTRRQRITADPVVSDGLIYAMDGTGRVSAISTSGALVWSVDVVSAADRGDVPAGGGLTAAGGRIYATSGAGEMTVLNAKTGATVWTQDFEAMTTGAPTVHNGVVYVSTVNATGWALSAETGRIIWQSLGATSDRGSTAGSSPVIAGPLVVFPFPSGQLVSAVIDSGEQAWGASVAGQRLGRAYGGVTDLTGAPVYANNTVYAASQAGRAAAFDTNTGSSRWRADVGATGPLWLAGGSLFFVNDINQLTRLDAATGETIWTVDMPFFENQRPQRRKSIFLHNGPVMAGGRLIVASNDGSLRQFDPVSGDLIGQISLPDGAASNPVIAGRTLYIVTENGQLLALK